MTIPDVTPTDLARNIIAIGIVATTLLFYLQQWEIPTQLDLAFWAVMLAYGFAAAKPAVNSVLKAYGKPQDGKPAQ